MIKKSLFVILIAVIAFILTTLNRAGSFKSIKSHSDLTNIKIYENVAGTEDLDIDRENGLLFISSTNRWNIEHSESSKDGIYLLNLNAKEATDPVRLKTTYNGEFHPHGISYLKKNGKDYLFAINHNSKGDFVEVFQFEKNQLKHLNSYSSKIMCCPNDLVAVDADKFYVTNDHGNSKGFSRSAEDYLMLANSYVIYFDGNRYRKVLENVNFANGINLSNDKKTIYVTGTSAGKIFVMDRNIETGDLTVRFTKELKTGADNISIDSDGSLWIGAHPQLLKFVAHSENTGEFSPSQVLRLTHKGIDDFEVSEIYLNTGEEISASSIAVKYKNEVFVGVVFENKLLRGTIKDD